MHNDNFYHDLHIAELAGRDNQRQKLARVLNEAVKTDKDNTEYLRAIQDIAEAMNIGTVVEVRYVA